MRWRDVLEPARMDRVAVVAPTDRLRGVLVAMADAGVIELEQIGDPATGPATDALDRTRHQIAATTSPDAAPVAPRLAPEPPDLILLEQTGRLEEDQVGRFGGKTWGDRCRVGRCR